MIYVESSGTDCLCVCVCSALSPVQFFCEPMTVAHQAPSVHGIFQARVVGRVAISSSRRSSRPRNRTQASCVSCVGRQILTHCATLAALTDLLIPVRSFASRLVFCLEDQVHSTSFCVFLLLLDSLSMYSCKI